MDRDNVIIMTWFILYIACGAAMWAYIIAWALSTSIIELVPLSVVFGWVAGLIWPMIVLVWAMQALFFGAAA